MPPRLRFWQAPRTVTSARPPGNCVISECDRLEFQRHPGRLRRPAHPRRSRLRGNAQQTQRIRSRPGTLRQPHSNAHRPRRNLSRPKASESTHGGGKRTGLSLLQSSAMRRRGLHLTDRLSTWRVQTRFRPGPLRASGLVRLCRRTCSRAGRRCARRGRSWTRPG